MIELQRYLLFMKTNCTTVSQKHSWNTGINALQMLLELCAFIAFTIDTNGLLSLFRNNDFGKLNIA